MIQFTYLPKIGWLIGSGLLASALIFLSYYWAKGRSSPRLRLTLAALRGLIIFAVLLCLFDPELVQAVKHQDKSRVAVLLDTSRSMSTKDVPQGRLTAAKSWIQQKLFPSVPSNVIAEYYSFDQALAPLASMDAPAASGEATGLAEALESVLSLSRPDPLSSVIVCSDGIENKRRDPEAIAKLYRRKGIAIHTVTVGTTNEMQDIVLENVQVKRAVPNQTLTKIGVSLRSSGFTNRSIPVQVFRGKQIIASQEVNLKEGAQSLDIDFTPRQKGYQVYEVKVPAQNGEWLTTNNRRMFGVEVVDPTIQVIYMEGTPQHPSSPIPEWKYLKDALESDPFIKVRTLYRRFGANIISPRKAASVSRRRGLDRPLAQ